MWSDGSRLENGQTGAGIAWLEPSGTWRIKQVSLGQRKEVFDAELTGASKALEIAKQLGYKGSIRVLLDSQAAIAQLPDNRVGPGQIWAIQAQDIARRLENQGCQITIQWVPGHQGILGNEKADQAAKAAAEKAPRYIDRSSA
jgi:ribonuclease HI